jgi:pimeloyl-ACP methyl ester carboxylesterase
VQLAEYQTYRRTVRTRSGEVGYAEVGSGPVALFVHGVGTNGALWRNVLELVRDERRCIALDLPGHGATPLAASQDVSLSGLATVVEDFCDALELTDVDLVANDTGGAVAQIVAAHRPDMLATFTLTDCDTRNNIPPKAFLPVVWLSRAGLLARVAPRMARTARGARRAFAGAYQTASAVPDDVVLAFATPVVGTRDAARDFQRTLTGLHSRDLAAVEPDLRRLEVPTRIVWGTRDRFFPLRYARWLGELIPGATGIDEIEGGRLFFPDERADEFVPHLLAHWRAHPRHGDQDRDGVQRLRRAT